MKNNTLLYIAGGLAITEITMNDMNPGYSSDQKTQIRWTLGTGIESMLTENLSLRLEYLYDDYSTEHYQVDSYASEVALSTHTARIGLTYYFN